MPCGCDGKFDEVKSGGVQGCLGVDQLDWGGTGGKIWEIWKCPCWGEPCDPKTAIYCLALWWCCPLCSGSRLYGHSMGQPCGLVPHVLMCIFCPNIAGCMTLYGVRKKTGAPGNLCGDLVCTHFCGCCSTLRLIRAASKDDWDFVSGCDLTPVASPLKLIS